MKTQLAAGGGTRKIKVNHIYENGTLKVIRFKQAACVSGWPGFLSTLNSSSGWNLIQIFVKMYFLLTRILMGLIKPYQIFMPLL